MKIYIANKMTGLYNYNFEWFDRARDYLIELGHDPVSPADLDRVEGFDGNGPTPSNMTLEACLRRDFAAICDGVEAIAFGPHWSDSRGARAERVMGQTIGCSMWRIDPDINSFYKEITIGLAGYARSGKDTVAQMITEYEFEQRSFAAPLKECLAALNPIVEADEVIVGPDGYVPVPRRISGSLREGGWELAKTNPEVRSLLQRLGTEAGRNVLGQNIWVDALFNQPSNGRIVISDVRFPNEAAAIKARGGLVWRVIRPGYGPVNNHPSETAIDDFNFDGEILNDGDLGQLQVRVKEIVGAAISH